MTAHDETADKRKTENSKSTAEEMPAAGPHDKKELQDPMKTPGAGALPEVGSRSTDVGSD